MDTDLKTYGLDPIPLFDQWFEEAKGQEINDPDAMCLATSTREGKPSNRIVLLKDFSVDGFKFHTNSGSQKGCEIADNPFAALCFYWKSTRKQVRIEGPVEIVTEDEAERYFETRPHGRQIGAWASNQSQPLEGKKKLKETIEAIEKQYEGENIPRPEYWNGYIVIPQSIEFWIGNRDRLHDRFIYKRDGEGWAEPYWLYP